MMGIRAMGRAALTAESSAAARRPAQSAFHSGYARRAKPLFIVSNTVKGKGVDFMENTFKWHGGGLAKEQLDEALASIAKNRRV